jgi:SAM-dependent methyltransferase
MAQGTIPIHHARETVFARAERERRRERVARLDALAPERDRFRRKNAYYHGELERLAKFFVPEGASVLEVGCATGDLLAALRPRRGLGIDLAPRMVELARAKHPELEFRVGDAEELDIDETFDFVVFSDVIGLLDDVGAALRALRRVMRPDTRLFVTYYNFLWQPVLDLGAKLGQRLPVPEQNWLGKSDLENLLKLYDLEVAQSGVSTLVPVDIPVLSKLANRLLARAPGFQHLALVQWFVARPVWQYRAPAKPLSCTVVVPCKNERGNVEEIFARVPNLGSGTELLFVDGHSDDGTVEEIQRRLPSRPGTRLILQGDGKGKGDAVRKGFAAAKGEVLFILDADLTVPPEDLPKFYAALAEGHGEMINGSRLVYPMEGEAMRFLNLVGNKFFSLAFTYILGRPIKDTLCGTKVLTSRSYQRIADGRAYFGDFDPFGDFDLLFGGARAGLKIIEVPVRYRARTYGDTKISRFRHGLLLLRMTALAFRKFKLTV